MLPQRVLHYFKIKDNFWLQYLAEKGFSPSVRLTQYERTSLERTEVTLVTEYVFVQLLTLNVLLDG